MTERRRLEQLAQIAGVSADADLAKVAAARRRLDAAEARLAELDRAAREALFLHAETGGALLAQDGYLRWASLRRTELALACDAARTELHACLAAAGQSFGRVAALKGLRARAAGAARVKDRK